MIERKYLGYAAEANRSDRFAPERGIPTRRLKHDGGVWSSGGIGPEQAERNRRGNLKFLRRKRFLRKSR
jgi:hypothetical protein